MQVIVSVTKRILDSHKVCALWSLFDVVLIQFVTWFFFKIIIVFYFTHFFEPNQGHDSGIDQICFNY
jgi:hypothetical protein